MKYIDTLREGERVSEVYLCRSRQTFLTKAGKPYESLVLQDKSGSIDAKIWDVNSGGIDEFESLDYVYITGDVTSFQGKPQLNVKRAKKAGPDTVNAMDYMPVSEHDIPEMYGELTGFIDKIKNHYLKELAQSFFGDEDFARKFQFQSAAKSVHHGFVGGLTEHTLNVTGTCYFLCKQYPILNRDLLLAAAMFHDIGKLEELAPFPANDYTDDGQLIGHIVLGAMKIKKHIETIEGFPEQLASELIHCILSHHGELEFGSPKKPALAEAVALSFADNVDAKMETMKEALAAEPEGSTKWQGYNRYLESNIRRTGKPED
ncbi:MAG: HD domain-containing protein [Clostridiales bacterium]|nr:HD domain-containing protein [Clostridiales bacterium]